MKIVWILLFFICVGAAWLLGYRARPREESPRKVNLPRDYLIGLNFLLNEETDKAVDIFIKMLEVDSDTVETHLAVGKLFRRRGEVDRAIRIHQNLIARPQLERIYREQSLFELGQDYLSAGMLDRAERIFLELVNAKSHSAQALRTLIDIYQQEKDWENAVQIATRYESVTRQNMQPVIAHYYCELAEASFNKGDYEVAARHLEEASAVDSSCVRASLLKAKIDMEQGDFKSALRNLKRIKDQNPHYLSEAIDLLASCYERLGQEDELVTYLKNLVEEYPRTPVVLILAERIRKWKGDKVAAQFVADYVRRYPSLGGLNLFINLYISGVQGQAKEDLHIVQKLMKKILANKPDYQCTSCGFSGKTLHWQCPGCRQWSTMMPIHSLEAGIA
ncbi:lipopolysaccharide assembly protein LapB [Aquicella lusitana]|uniref:Lipopolysaccharide assembly protein B n=1 Tax=Aquicella lusitana TaxID=254246 RepID=A0A370GHL6_9COXI|nr:lipopolysaccharide assembly protein LapB [Aquicella lusitana]RDI42736.1 lipopolysaccharide biosynthesis regulator YciM [Aquicella lusitana]VVC73409.1 Lipopolysaccharide assembly protein B [Aquicella lusitana]